MSKAGEEILAQLVTDGEITDGEPLLQLQGDSKAARIRGIVAEAIDTWLWDTDPARSEESAEVREARTLARRYRYPYVDLFPARGNSPIDHDLVNELPVDLMVRYQFAVSYTHLTLPTSDLV